MVNAVRRHRNQELQASIAGTTVMKASTDSGAAPCGRKPQGLSVVPTLSIRVGTEELDMAPVPSAINSGSQMLTPPADSKQAFQAHRSFQMGRLLRLYGGLECRHACTVMRDNFFCPTAGIRANQA